MMFGPISQGVPHVKTGKLPALGVTGAEASPLLPGVKPLMEQGFPRLLVFNWFPVMVPARTPDAVVAVIGAGVKRVVEDAEVRAKLDAVGIPLVWLGPQELARTIDADLKRWSEVAQRARMQSPD